jgi:hypothetical protein
MLWRVELEKIAIQLAVEDNGMKQVIYLSANAWRKPTVPYPGGQLNSL